MTNDEKRIRISEICGIKFFSPCPIASGCRCGIESLPDFLNDLNAMNGAETIMSREQGVKFRLLLSMNSDGPKAKYLTVEAAMCHAKSNERADAFLAVFDK